LIMLVTDEKRACLHADAVFQGRKTELGLADESIDQTVPKR